MEVKMKMLAETSDENYDCDRDRFGIVSGYYLSTQMRLMSLAPDFAFLQFPQCG